MDNLILDNFLFDLPKESIAQHPIKNRMDAKLLFYDKGHISHHYFYDLPKILSSHCHLIFNDTKVIPARMIFKKPTGGNIEIFLLKPVMPFFEHTKAMNVKHECVWECLIGNKKKWKESMKLCDPTTGLTASRKNNIITFKWNSNLSFSTIIDKIGKLPLPPYITRDAEIIDMIRYQTIFSKSEGSVAAPTAGLHFTTEIINKIKRKDILIDFLTLHISAGTFQPIQSAKIQNHTMHSERIIISKKTILSLLDTSKKIIAVGTTSMRTLESLYWFGVKLINKETNFHMTKDEYLRLKSYDNLLVLNTILDFMEKNNIQELNGQTEIFIYPGYHFQLCKGLITNYHLPTSTLILLVAAFIGENWRKVYNEALKNNYRFLSYGDSSLLIP